MAPCDKHDQVPTTPTNRTMHQDLLINHLPTHTPYRHGHTVAHLCMIHTAHFHRCGIRRCTETQNHLQPNKVHGLDRVPLSTPTSRSNRTTTMTTRILHPRPPRPTVTMNLHLPVCQTSPPCPTPTHHLRSICNIDEQKDIGESLQADQYENFAGSSRSSFAAEKAAAMDTEEDITATVSEASCGPRMTSTPSSPAKAREGAVVVPKVLAGERIQKVAMVKS